MHPTTQFQVPSWTKLRCLFLFLMKNHLVPPRLDLVFLIDQQVEATPNNDNGLMSLLVPLTSCQTCETKVAFGLMAG
jgi:hypothetical protein